MNYAKIQIVVIEDSPADTEILLRVFRKHGLANEVVLLKDGAEALEFLMGQPGGTSPSPSPGENASAAGGAGAAERPAMILILDLKLPKVAGIEVLQRIRSDPQRRNTPVIVLTSSQEERDWKEAHALGVSGYLTKPMMFADFAKITSELAMNWLLVKKLAAASARTDRIDITYTQQGSDGT